MTAAPMAAACGIRPDPDGGRLSRNRDNHTKDYYLRTANSLTFCSCESNYAAGTGTRVQEMNMMNIGTVFLEELDIGMSRSLAKVITDREIRLFAEVSEDRNPIHLDDEAAAESIFKERIAHGMLCASLFSALLGERLPGHGTIYLGQNLRFMAPVRLGDEVVASVTVTAIDLGRRRVTLDCLARVGDTVVIMGEATVLAPSLRFD